MNTKVAQRIATHAHKDQVDKSGKPYINHPAAVAVAVRLAGYSDEVQAVAWLHDVIEDTHITLDNLKQAGFSLRVVSAVEAITHRSHEPRKDYMIRVVLDPLAHVVKFFDVEHNTDPSRLDKLPVADRVRLVKKYSAAMKALGEIPTPEDVG